MEQQQAQKQAITKDTLIGDIVENYPQVIETLLSYGVHCVGCHVSPFETLEQGFRIHGLTDADIQDAVKNLNKVLEENGDGDKKREVKEFDYSKATIEVTDKAAEKIKEFIKQENKKALRVSVIPGGCSGYQYGMELDDEKTSNDIVIDEKGINIYIDRESMKKLNGCQIDFVEALQGAGFKINNPNATASCGCGNSFG